MGLAQRTAQLQSFSVIDCVMSPLSLRRNRSECVFARRFGVDAARRVVFGKMFTARNDMSKKSRCLRSGFGRTCCGRKSLAKITVLTSRGPAPDILVNMLPRPSPPLSFTGHTLHFFFFLHGKRGMRGGCSRAWAMVAASHLFSLGKRSDDNFGMRIHADESPRDASATVL